jgi:hypothetical protein
MRIGIAVLALVVVAVGPTIGAARAACLQGDADADGICDDDDPCGNPEPHALREPRVSVLRRPGVAGDAIVRVSGIVPLLDDAPVDPTTSGLRAIMREGTGEGSQVVVDLSLAPGPGWTASGPGAWIYRDPLAIDGVRRASVREIPSLPAYQAARAYVVTIDARTSGVPAVSDAVWHHVSILLAADGSTTRCADQPLRPRAIDPKQAWQLWDARCKVSPTGATLRCRGGRVRWPCRVSRAEDEMRCLLADLARGQEEYRAANGTYCSSSCVQLLSIPQPPYTLFVMTGWSFGFEALAAHVAAPGILCQWKSADTPHLSCGPTP